MKMSVQIWAIVVRGRASHSTVDEPRWRVDRRAEGVNFGQAGLYHCLLTETQLSLGVAA